MPSSSWIDQKIHSLPRYLWRRCQEIHGHFRTGNVDGSRTAYHSARTRLKAAEVEFDRNLQALLYSHELYHCAQESLARVNHMIESFLSEGPLQGGNLLHVYMQYRELQLRGLIH